TSPFVLVDIIGGIALLTAFAIIERRVAQPMFHLELFKIRAFTAGNAAGLFSSIGRGGLQFMLIIWLQGIWLPLHGYDFERTPLWAGIYMLPLTAGFLVAGPLAGRLSDKYGARGFATSGMLLGASSFFMLLFVHADFSYWVFAALIFLNGVGTGMFFPPNTTGIMNSVPAEQRGAASGMRATFQNSGQVLSVGVFFSLMIIGLASTLPNTMRKALVSQGVSLQVATKVANSPPVGNLFAAFLGFNPMKTIVPAAELAKLTPAQSATITGKTFFPHLISDPFMHGMRIAFTFSLVLYLVAAIASRMRGSRTPLPIDERELANAIEDAIG
ncbi:MAG: MFS transporter, partial [Actinomycetota bacterium]